MVHIKFLLSKRFIFVFQVLELIDSAVTQVHAVTQPPNRDSSMAEIAFTASKKCHPFNIITAAVAFHYDIMVRGSLYVPMYLPKHG